MLVLVSLPYSFRLLFLTFEIFLQFLEICFRCTASFFFYILCSFSSLTRYTSVRYFHCNFLIPAVWSSFCFVVNWYILVKPILMFQFSGCLWNDCLACFYYYIFCLFPHLSYLHTVFILICLRINFFYIPIFILLIFRSSSALLSREICRSSLATSCILIS